VKVDVTSPSGAKAGSAELPDDLFGITPNTAVLHQVVTAQLAHRRAGTHATKTRAEVSGGGAKPWRQKGTGRARQGSIRSPQWRGGGIAHGPKPRDYSQRTPKKMIRLALCSALSDRAAEGRVKVVDAWGIDEPKTKRGIEALEGIGLRSPGERVPRVLLVLDRSEHAVWKSFRNLGERVQIVLPDELNAYDILVNDWLVFSQTTLDATVARFSRAAAAASDAMGTERASAGGVSPAAGSDAMQEEQEEEAATDA
jgi:large subunit ribosomal protein L4